MPSSCSNCGIAHSRISSLSAFLPQKLFALIRAFMTRYNLTGPKQTIKSKTCTIHGQTSSFRATQPEQAQIKVTPCTQLFGQKGAEQDRPEAPSNFSLPSAATRTHVSCWARLTMLDARPVILSWTACASPTRTSLLLVAKNFVFCRPPVTMEQNQKN